MTNRTGYLQSALQVLDGNGALPKVNVIHSKCQSFLDTAASMEEEPHQQTISEVGCRFFYSHDFINIKINLHNL